jgi:hypothetical protein
LGVGPTVIGIMTDYVFQDPGDIRYSMSVVIGMAAPLMVVMMLLAMKPYRRFHALAQGGEEPAAA